MEHHNEINKKSKFIFNKGFLKKLAISTVAFTSLLIGSAMAENQISTVYHVYINDQIMGTVDNDQIINNIIDEKISSLEEKYKDIELVAEDIILIPEQVFRLNVNNNETVQNVKENLKIVAEAASISIDGETVAYLDSEEDANEVIKKYKLQYVSEEELKEVEDREAAINAGGGSTNIPYPELEEGQSRILDVTMTEKVSISVENVNPEQILSTDDTLTLLKKGTLEEKKYKVQEGDVLGSIAMDHDLTTKDLLELNPKISEDELLQIDQELTVTKLVPLLTVNVMIEQLKEEEIPYGHEVKEDSSMYKGDQKVTREGKEGQKLVGYEISRVNGQTVKKEKISEDIISEPVDKITVKGTKVVPSRGTGQLVWPTVGGYISSHVGYRWGSMHKGIDIARPSDRTIKAADNGTVVSAGYDGGYGNKIVINHNNGLKTVYAHLASISVSVGQTVSQGQKIGVMGATGHSTGVHLHFEVYHNGELKNPVEYLP
ncbi:peptidoglycan DD-metalloendopeptidase family protein [Litchfieldia alkalitelluris]|uniref:peptidoglycan DD-metalloendopeptidase family protein n=1 Tax=Litchfieldia alkalitelluris TaxID=304268 RepID=UPI001F3ECBEE|nr:M23 family metallopeptidase [Litchfieldia alkalitelluris]